MTAAERVALVEWIEAHPRAPARFGRRQITADVKVSGEVGYLAAAAAGKGEVVFHPRRSRFERHVDDLALLEVKVGARYRSAARVLRAAARETSA